MSKMSVKVPVKKVIAQLEAKLKAVKAEYQSIDKLNAEFDRAQKQYQVDIRAAAIAAVSSNPSCVTECDTKRSWNRGIYSDVAVELTIPFSKIKGFPKKPNEPEFEFHSHKSVISEIEGMIRVLKLTDDEYVNATTLKSVSAYL